jgi:integration host factor subunit alpha
MTKAQLVEHLFDKVGFSKKDSSDVVEMILETIKDALLKGEKVKISGFGNFDVKKKKARRGRNPQTGDDLTISARRVLTFKPSQVLKSAINARN